MANTNSNLVTLLAAAATDQTAPLKGIDTGALLLFIRGKVTCPATPATTDTLTLVPAALIPIGAKLAPEESWVYCETDPGTALTLDIGMASNPDALADGLALTTAATTGGKKYFDVSGGGAPLGITAPITVTTPEAIIATPVTSTDVDATVIQFCIAYYATA